MASTVAGQKRSVKPLIGKFPMPKKDFSVHVKGNFRKKQMRNDLRYVAHQTLWDESLRI